MGFCRVHYEEGRPNPGEKCPYCRISDLEREVRELKPDKQRLDWLDNCGDIPQRTSELWSSGYSLRQAIDDDRRTD